MALNRELLNQDIKTLSDMINAIYILSSTYEVCDDELIQYLYHAEVTHFKIMNDFEEGVYGVKFE